MYDLNVKNVDVDSFMGHGRTLLRNIYDMTSFLEQTSKNVDRNLSDLINSLESTELSTS